MAHARNIAGIKQKAGGIRRSGCLLFRMDVFFQQRQYFAGQLFQQRVHFMDADGVRVIHIPVVQIELSTAHIFADELFLRLGKFLL